jgi:hypothetical protein
MDAFAICIDRLPIHTYRKTIRARDLDQEDAVETAEVSGNEIKTFAPSRHALLAANAARPLYEIVYQDGAR